MKYISLLLILPAALLAQGAAPVNPLLDQFLKKGIEIPGMPAVKLKEPMLNERMDAKELATALDEARDKIPFDLFVKKGNKLLVNEVKPINDPKDKKDDEGRVRRHAQKIEVRFVVHGKLSTVLKKDMLGQLIGGAKAKATALKDEDLAARGIKPLAGKGGQEKFTKLTMNVLDDVLVTGITRNITTSGRKSAFTTSILDNRFQNAWQPIAVNGKLGKASPYSGLGGYVYVMELPNQPGALYVEMHYVMHEPYAWFEGKDLLRSKLPVAIRDNVNNFRQALSKDN